MSEENIENLITSDDTFARILVNSYPLQHAKFAGHCLINNNISTFRKKINLYISYTVDLWSKDLNKYFTLSICLFTSVK